MHITEYKYIRGINYHKNTFAMYNLKTNFEKFFNISKSIFKSG